MAKVLCPCCFEESNIEEIQFVCTNTSRNKPCIKAQNKEPIAYSEVNKKNPVCSECGQKLVTKICPKCGFVLPYNIGMVKNYPLSIIGAKESGKSNFVAVLVNALKNDVGRAFKCSLMACGDSTIQRYKDEFYNPLYRHRTCVRGTDSGEVTPLIYSLLFERKSSLFHKAVNDSISLTFFDAAGENFDTEKDMQTISKYLCHSSGIILLLDPLQLPKVRDELEDKIKLPEENTDVTDLLTRTITVIRQQSGKTDGKIDIPIAISFTKIDAVDSMLDPASCLKNDSTHIQKGCFDKVDFQQVNEEMQSLVDDWLGADLLQQVSMNFETFGFFGLSALGSNPDVDNKIPKFRPFRVTDPFLWLLARQGIIPETK